MSNDTKPQSGATTSYKNAPTRTVTAGGWISPTEI